MGEGPGPESETSVVKFGLIRPCKMCPFRTDCMEGWLGAARAQEIINGITLEDQTFACHETTHLDDEDTETGVAHMHGDEQHCAGAAILLEKIEAPNQLMRISERLRTVSGGQGYDRDRMDMGAPVFDSTEDFVRHHAGEDHEEAEPCSVCGPGCEAPAGYMVGGKVVTNIPEEGATTCCPGCGEYVCASCRCWCQEDEED